MLGSRETDGVGRCTAEVTVRKRKMLNGRVCAVSVII